MFAALGHFVHRFRWPVLVLGAVFLLASVAMLRAGGRLGSGTIHGVEAERAEALAAEVLGPAADTTFVVVFEAPETADDAALRAGVGQALAPLRDDPRVLSVMGPGDVPPPIGEGMVNREARAALALVTLRGDADAALAAYPEVRARLTAPGLHVTATGKVPFLHDMDARLARDLERAELFSLPIALLLLLLAFRTPVAAALPVGVGGLAVLGGIAIVLGASRFADVAHYTVNICSLIGLGLSIDYSLFIVSRYTEELAAGLGYEAALSRALETAGRAVAFSGFAVATGLAGLLFFNGSYLFAMGVGGIIVVVLAMLFALTFLPALLAVLGPRIHAGRLPLPALATRDGVWHRAAAWVMRHPVLVLVPAISALVVMGLPLRNLHLAAADVRVLATDVEARHGYELLRADFPERTENRVLVAVGFPPAPAPAEDQRRAVEDLRRRVAAIPGVRRVEDVPGAAQPPPAAGQRVALLNAVTEGSSDSEATRDVVRRIREDRHVGAGALLVGGQAAMDIDTTAYVLHRAPRVVAFVVAVTLVVLFLLFRSVVLPVKAVIMNGLSITASLGALVWVFQEGHLFVSSPRPLEPALPVLLFCVLFGLSMDYEVLLLARMQEAYKRTGDNTHAVAEGLEKSARLITSAAAIMVAVFGAFSFARVVVVQAIGFGMALAVLLDATVVRLLIVPATMRLLGRYNWWAPKLLSHRRESSPPPVPREAH